MRLVLARFSVLALGTTEAETSGWMPVADEMRRLGRARNDQKGGIAPRS